MDSLNVPNQANVPMMEQTAENPTQTNLPTPSEGKIVFSMCKKTHTIVELGLGCKRVGTWLQIELGLGCKRVLDVGEKPCKQLPEI